MATFYAARSEIITPLPWLTFALPFSLPASARPSGQVTVMVRPEHAEIVTDTEAATLRGTLHSTVYFGTDTHFNITLADGTPFTVRRQNDRKGATSLAPGTPVSVPSRS